MVADVPVMVSFGHPPLHGFSMKEVDTDDTLQKVLEVFRPETWNDDTAAVVVKVSDTRDGGYDKFSLKNTIGLVKRIRKTDILWINFEKPLFPTSTVPVKNAFEILKGASDAKTLPTKISNPVNEKAALFNDVVDDLGEKGAKFPLPACAPRVKNKQTGAATELVYELSSKIWKIGQCKNQLENSSLWWKIPNEILGLVKTSKKKEELIMMTQFSSKIFASEIRELASLVIMAKPELLSYRVALLGTADVFDSYSVFLKAKAAAMEENRLRAKNIATAAEAVCVQLANREKFTVINEGTEPLTHPTISKMFEKMRIEGPYNPVNIAVLLPTDRYQRSYILNKALPKQAPERVALWAFENINAPQSIFCFTVNSGDTAEEIFRKVQQLKPNLLKLQKFFYPREFYHQFSEQLQLVTGITPQMQKLITSMIMGDNRKLDNEVKDRFEEAVMSGDPDFIFDMRHFNGSEIKFKDFLEEFRVTVQEYMVEDRGRHEKQYDGTIVSRVSYGFSLPQIFKEICQRVQSKFPSCPLPQSEAFLYRYLIPRTQAASDAACRSEALIPLKLSVQQKVIEKPNVDAHYNAAQYKYIKNLAVELGRDVVTMIGWDDKTGVDVGEPEQPTTATQHAGRSWVVSGRKVGEGQHSFHKTNLCPSVRLIHEIPSSMEGSFYRGLPQVCLKDAIFQHSTSSRQATELLQMFQAQPEVLIRVCHKIEK